MNKLRLILIFYIVFQGSSVLAQTESALEYAFDKNALLKHVKSLSSDAFQGRRTGEKGALKARKYIVNQFHRLQVKPLGSSFEQAFTFHRSGKQYKGVNILGRIEGLEFPNKYIVISAHYDHEGVKQGHIYNGADDNASGVSALFAFAEYFEIHPPKHTVILAAFDAEELGLQGSKYYVNHSIVPLKDIVINLNLDMISRSNKNELFAVGGSFNKNLMHLISKVKTSSKIQLVTGHDGYDRLENWTYTSDHANFHKKNIPFLYFGVEDHKDYHEPTDDFENIHPEFYTEAVKTIITVFTDVDKVKTHF
ncbi:MAG: M28 family peptidase [Algibacter sp.]|uniref:M28 family peptidase n=1 Tax=Algibacter sp. TaxID=1872428 RepID=UPI00329682E6